MLSQCGQIVQNEDGLHECTSRFDKVDLLV